MDQRITSLIFLSRSDLWALGVGSVGSRGWARSGRRWCSRAVAINRNLFTRITTAGHSALGLLMQLLRATDSATAEPHGAATLDAKSPGAAFITKLSS